MRAVIIIPARFRSSRYPGKPLVNLLGKPMILWVAELSSRAVGKDNVYIATDDERIASVVADAGFQFVMTDTGCLTGTDRIAEAAENIEADIYVNVQGDEPLVDPDDIMLAIKKKSENADFVINGYCWISGDENPESVNIPKVVTNESDQLIYMSRSKVPGHKDSSLAPTRYKKQVCIYAFSKQELRDFRQFGRKSVIESSEDIEILRFLELGKSVLMFETTGGSLAVDVQSDVEPVVAALKQKYKA